MGLENIEVMRAHRTKINQAAESASAPQPRPIHVYLLRYPDKGRILKAETNTLKDNPFCDSQIFISDDVSKAVRSERAKLRKDHLKQLKEREGVQFAFIPWSVPGQFPRRYCIKKPILKVSSPLKSGMISPYVAVLLPL